MGEVDVQIDDVLVIVAHPFGDVEVPLRTWMVLGPGPRPFVAPTAALHRVTRKPLPVTVIPVAYRNDRESRALIRAGKIANPWEHPVPDEPESL